MDDTEKSIRADIKKLVVLQPFFATVILTQKLVITRAVPTAAVDGVHLYINPYWYCELDPQERITILCHEVLHLTNKHNLRKGNREKKVWNIATDLAINKHLVDKPFKLPQDDKHKGQYDEENKFGDGADAEFIYSALLKEVADKEEELQEEQAEESPEGDDPQSDDGNAGMSDSEDESEDGESPSNEESTQDDPQEEGDGSPNDPEGGEPSDSGNGGSIRDQAIDAIRDKYGVPDVGDVLDHPELTEENQDELEVDANMTTHKAMNIAKKRGNMPASIVEEIEREYDQKVNWSDVMQDWTEGLCPADSNWVYPHEVHLQDDVILPSNRVEAYGDIVMGIDTSGSMDEEELKIAIQETFNALEFYFDNAQEDPKITLIYCDSEIHEVLTIYSPSQVTNPVGRGGTSFSPFFDYVKGMAEMPKGLVIVTDGYCTVYEHDKPPCDVVWLLTSMSARDFDTPFGRCIEIDR